MLTTTSALTCAAVIAAAAPAWCACAAPAAAIAKQARTELRLAQFGSGGDQPEVSPSDVQKYVSVYRAMQANHKLTVQQAAAQQGLTVEKFRTLEDQIMRNDALRAQVRKELRAPAKPAPTPTK